MFIIVSLCLGVVLYFVVYFVYAVILYRVYIVMCIVSPFLCRLFPTFVQVYRTLPSGGNPIAVNIIT